RFQQPLPSEILVKRLELSENFEWETYIVRQLKLRVELSVRIRKTVNIHRKLPKPNDSNILDNG
ncbi:hypothetical protein DD592_27905, partial [Enterobacter cloacae complex sp. 2DZ2F20B]